MRLRAFIEQEGWRGAWVVKDATANSGVGSGLLLPEDLPDNIDARHEVVLQSYLIIRCCGEVGSSSTVAGAGAVLPHTGAMAQVCALPCTAFR